MEDYCLLDVFLLDKRQIIVVEKNSLHVKIFNDYEVAQDTTCSYHEYKINSGISVVKRSLAPSRTFAALESCRSSEIVLYLDNGDIVQLQIKSLSSGKVNDLYQFINNVNYKTRKFVYLLGLE